MSVILNQTSSEIYFGNLTVATADVAPGIMVVPNYGAGTCAAPATDAIGDGFGLQMVANYDSYAATNITNSKDFVVKVGKYARLKTLEVGDEFTTDQFIGTYGSINVGDIFAVNGTAGSGVVGKFIAIAARTSAFRVMVIEKTTMYGSVNALKFRVIAA